MVHPVYAMILNEVVQQRALFDNYEEANRVTRAVYGDTAFAVDCQQYACSMGDKYIEGLFYKADGTTLIKYIPTQEQQIDRLTRNVIYLVDYTLDVDYKLSINEL